MNPTILEQDRQEQLRKARKVLSEVKKQEQEKFKKGYKYKCIDTKTYILVPK